jgi:hypothetical protein
MKLKCYNSTLNISTYGSVSAQMYFALMKTKFKGILSLKTGPTYQRGKRWELQGQRASNPASVNRRGFDSQQYKLCTLTGRESSLSVNGTQVFGFDNGIARPRNCLLQLNYIAVRHRLLVVGFVATAPVIGAECFR